MKFAVTRCPDSANAIVTQEGGSSTAARTAAYSCHQHCDPLWLFLVGRHTARPGAVPLVKHGSARSGQRAVTVSLWLTTADIGYGFQACMAGVGQRWDHPIPPSPESGEVTRRWRLSRHPLRRAGLVTNQVHQNHRQNTYEKINRLRVPRGRRTRGEVLESAWPHRGCHRIRPRQHRFLTPRGM